MKCTVLHVSCQPLIQLGLMNEVYSFTCFMPAIDSAGTDESSVQFYMFHASH